MPPNLDPKAPVPSSGADGTLQLRETRRTSHAGLLVRLLCLACFTPVGLVYFYQQQYGGGFSPEWATLPIKLAAAACIGLPILFTLPLLGRLLSPSQLIIDNRGVTLSGQHISWSAVTAITTEVIRKKDSARTWTILSGGTARLSWPPDFGVAPEALAAYIAQRQNQSLHRRKIEYIPRQQRPAQWDDAQWDGAEAQSKPRRGNEALGIGLIIVSLLIIGAAGVYAHKHGMI